MKPFLFIFFFAVSLFAEDPILPDPKLTPGAVMPGVTMQDIETHGYTAKVRNVPERIKKAVFIEYFGVVPPVTGDYEIDHLISLELGGSNDIENLWPQSYKTQPWNAHRKDVLENKLHKLIVEGTISLKEAQDAISKDWIAAYKKYVGEKSEVEFPVTPIE